MARRRVDLGGVDAVVLPGGFAHGDYLRPGAIARFSPVMDGGAGASPPTAGRSSASATASRCSPRPGSLPGALQKNRGLKFLCTTDARSGSRPPTRRSPPRRPSGDVLRIPINHFEGNYTCDAETLAELRAEDRIVLRYVDNPNGSVDDIAGMCNEGRNVVGLMPHPERACHPLLGSTDGAVLLRSLARRAPARGLTPAPSARAADAGPLEHGRLARRAPATRRRRCPCARCTRRPRSTNSSSRPVRSTFVAGGLELALRSSRSWMSCSRLSGSASASSTSIRSSRFCIDSVVRLRPRLGLWASSASR